MDPKARLKQYVEFKGYSRNYFTQQAGLANGYLTSDGHIYTEQLAKILEVFDDLNLEWVLLGKGYMLNPPKERASFNYPVIREENIITALKKYQKDYPDLALTIELIESEIHSYINTIRALIISAQSKDQIILKFEAEHKEFLFEREESRKEKTALRKENDKLRKELSQLKKQQKNK